MELLRLLHQAQRLAVALRVRCTERALQALAGGVALFNGDDGHGQRIEIRYAADDGCIVGEAAVAVQLKKAGKKMIDKIRARGALAAARDLDALIG